MIFGFLGAQELILIIIVALILFGGGKLAGVGKSLGQSVREFKQEVNTNDDTNKNSDAADTVNKE